MLPFNHTIGLLFRESSAAGVDAAPQIIAYAAANEGQQLLSLSILSEYQQSLTVHYNYYNYYYCLRTTYEIAFRRIQRCSHIHVNVYNNSSLQLLRYAAAMVPCKRSAIEASLQSHQASCSSYSSAAQQLSLVGPIRCTTPCL